MGNREELEQEVENMDLVTVYDYFDQPLSFTFKLKGKLYYANLVDYERETRTDVFWVIGVTPEQIDKCERKVLTLYDVMCGVGKGVETEEPIYIIRSSSNDSKVNEYEFEKSMEMYSLMLPAKDVYLDKEEIL